MQVGLTRQNILCKMYHVLRDSDLRLIMCTKEIPRNIKGEFLLEISEPFNYAL